MLLVLTSAHNQNLNQSRRNYCLWANTIVMEQMKFNALVVVAMEALIGLIGLIGTVVDMALFVLLMLRIALLLKI